MRKLKLKNVIKHFKRITKHRWLVFKLSIRAGVPWRGLWHDFSKYSPTEFWESARYYQEGKSPILVCIEEKGYSEARLHHLGRNKHHPQYWYDEFAKIQNPVIPYQYVAEMICDQIAASQTYNGKNWSPKENYEYWKRIEKNTHINAKINCVLTEIFERISKEGVNNVLKPKILKATYNKYVYGEDIKDEHK